MSKKKNTLKDLDEFLKQQAASLVSPSPLSEKLEESSQKKEDKASTSSLPASFDTVQEQLKTLLASGSPSSRNKLYDLIIQALESSELSSPEDKMLINTALYLKSGDRWKEVIRAYWKDKNAS